MIKHWFSDVSAFRRDPLLLLTNYAKTQNLPLIPLALGPAPVVLVNDPLLVKPLMRVSEDVVDKGRLVKKIGDVIGESSLTLSGEEHRKRRAVLHERLSRGVANTYVKEMNANIRHVLAQLAREDRFRADIVGGGLALKLACVALFGHRVLSPADELAVMSAFHTLESDLQAEMFRFLPKTPWTKRRDARRRSDALRTMDIVIGKVTAAASSSSVLMALKEAGLSDTEIRDEITTMIIAGFHTTGAAVAWICHYLCSQPAEVALIRLEYAALAGETGEIDAARLPEAKVSLAFVKEVLRLYPSAWWLTRELKQNATVGETPLRAGTTLIVSPWVYHRNPKYFAEPDKFSLAREHSGAAYMPFGVGARACVGMGVALLELQLIALELAATFDLQQLADLKALNPKAGITLNAPPMEIGIRAREPQLDLLHEAA